MNKLGSEFLKEFDHYERPFLFGRTKRHVFFYTFLALAIGLSLVLYMINFPDMLLVVILVVFLLPLTLYGMGKDKDYLERYRFRLTKQERSYQTDHHGSRLTKNDFKMKKGGVCEVIPKKEAE